ncbi:MAG TPA: PAS domain S-box protein, partial [Bryobacteraceae bacterium]|nr:PAS domain S-box protein [Bryobacteraceae bacterium]
MAPLNRAKTLRACLVLAALILLGQRYLDGGASLGLLYAIPLAIAAVFLNRWQVLLAAAAAAILREQFGPSPWGLDAPEQLATGLLAFGSAGLFVAETVRSRRLQAAIKQELRQESALRQKVEGDARSLIESSPAAIITVGPDGRIDMTNQAAKRLLALGPERASGQPIGDYFPLLGELMKSKRVGSLVGTMVESNGRRRNGENFFAQMWLSSYESKEGVRLSAIVADASEQLRDREEIGLRQLLMNSRIIAAAVSHEIRNLAAAASALHGNVGASYGISDNEDFEALGGLIQAMRKLS